MEKPIKGSASFPRDRGCPMIGKTHTRYPLNLLEWGEGVT